MAVTSERPVGGFFVKQRAPRVGQEPRWREPRVHTTLAEAFDEAEKLARQEACSFSILQEIGCADPVLSPSPDAAEILRQRLAEHEADAAAKADDLRAAIYRAEGGR